MLLPCAVDVRRQRMYHLDRLHEVWHHVPEAAQQPCDNIEQNHPPETEAELRIHDWAILVLGSGCKRQPRRARVPQLEISFAN